MSRPLVLAFVVDGIAQTAGSKRAFPIRRPGGQLGVAVVDDNPKSRDWKTRVAETAAVTLATVDPAGILLRGPIKLTLHFEIVRPLGQYSKKGGLKPSARTWPTVKPDVLKLARAVEDALTGVVWHDDAQVVVEELRKTYADRARLFVRVEEV